MREGEKIKDSVEKDRIKVKSCMAEPRRILTEEKREGHGVAWRDSGESEPNLHIVVCHPM